MDRRTGTSTWWRRIVRASVGVEPDVRRDAAALFVLGLLLYGATITHPQLGVIDETLYCEVGALLPTRPLLTGELSPLPHNYEHPPLGKLWMWASASSFGENEFGCRLPSVVAGASVGATLFVLASRFFGTRRAGFLASGAWYLDTMAYFGSTIGMLDVPAVAFVTGAYAVALRPALDQRWRVASVVLLGLGVATKLSSLFAAPVLFYLLLRGTVPADARSRARRLAELALWLVGAFQATYLPYMAAWGKTLGPAGVLPSLQNTWVAMFGYHSGSGYFLGLNPAPASWILFGRPLWGEYVYLDGGRVAVSATVGNQILWYFSIGGMLLLLLGLAYGRWHKGSATVLASPDLERFRLASLMLCATTVPYFFMSRILYQFYTIGFLPFLALVGTSVYLFIERSPRLARYRFEIVALVALTFLLRLPFVEGVPVPVWYARLLLPWLPDATLT